jgi:hypothetical protein
MCEAQRKAMPHHDPVPRRTRSTDYERAASAWSRYRRMMKWMVLVAAVAAGLSLLYLSWSGEPMRLHMVVATIAGVGFTVMVGTGLMGLVFLSSRTGHDEDAGHGGQNDDPNR